MIKVSILSFVLALSGCASLMKQEEQGGRPFEKVQQQKLADIEALIDQQQYEKALNELEYFRKEYPSTPYFQASNSLTAKAQYGRGNFQEAISIYEQIQNSTMDQNPHLWAQARYDSSLCYEALGESVKSLSTLLGLEKNESLLKDHIKQAELPARIGSLYFEQGRDKEARQYLDKADRGLKILINQKGLDKNRMQFAETMYRMGRIVVPHISSENFSRILQMQRRSQIYLIRVMELDVPPWPARSADDLIKDYRNYWSFIQTQWGQTEDKPQKLAALKNLHALLSESLYRQPSEPETTNDSLKTYFDSAIKLEQEISADLFSSGETTLMTEKLPQKGEKSWPKGHQENIVSPDPNS